MFAEGFLRLAKGQQVFVTEELTQTFWEVLHQLNPQQWAHAVRVASEDPDPPDPGKMWPPGKLLAWGRSYLDPTARLLPAPKDRATEDPDFPRRPGEDGLSYIQRYARHLGGQEVKRMPDIRLPYREPEEIDRGDDADNY
jgi:hypothetical protein